MRRGEDRAERVLKLNINKLIAIAIVMLAAVLTVVCIFKVVSGFMRVSEFEITGASSYEREEIITASGIKMRDKLYSIDKKEVEKRIMRECPYISSVKVKRSFPNKVKIEVESFAAAWYIEIEGDFYALDSELRVLEETSNGQKFIDGKITELTLPNIKSAVVGSELTFGNDDAEREFAYEFMTMVNRMSFKSRLSLVDIDNRFDINIGIDGVIDVYMGNSVGAEEKLKAIETALASPLLENCIAAEIYAADPSAVSIRPTYDYSHLQPDQTVAPLG